MGLFRRFGLPIVISSYAKNKNLILTSEYACIRVSLIMFSLGFIDSNLFFSSGYSAMVCVLPWLPRVFRFEGVVSATRPSSISLLKHKKDTFSALLTSTVASDPISMWLNHNHRCDCDPIWSDLRFSRTKKSQLDFWLLSSVNWHKLTHKIR